MTWLVTMLRYRETSTDQKNGLTCEIYTLMLQSVGIYMHVINSQRVAFPYPIYTECVCTDRMSVNGEEGVFSSKRELNK